MNRNSNEFIFMSTTKATTCYYPTRETIREIHLCYSFKLKSRKKRNKTVKPEQQDIHFTTARHLLEFYHHLTVLKLFENKENYRLEVAL
jgi:hypothetical protein